LKSTVEAPAPLFVSFIGAAKEYNDKKDSLKSSAALQDSLI
jgi:CTP synthase